VRSFGEVVVKSEDSSRSPVTSPPHIISSGDLYGSIDYDSRSPTEIGSEFDFVVSIFVIREVESDFPSNVGVRSVTHRLVVQGEVRVGFGTISTGLSSTVEGVD